LVVVGSALAGAGCDLVFGLSDPGVPSDAAQSGSDGAIDVAVDAPACGFRNKTMVAELSSNFIGPQFTLAGSELFLVDGTNHNIMRSTLSPEVGFLVPALIQGLGTAKGSEPSLSADGHDLVFTLNNQAFETRWEDGGWGPVQSVVGLESEIDDGVELSADGLTLYYNKSDILWEVHRMDRNGPFEGPQERGARFMLPAISYDQLEIFGYDTSVEYPHGAVWVRHRAELDKPFGRQTFVVDDAASPDISEDGRTLIVKTADRLATLERNCQ
jgi:hypothetical protein